MINAVRPLGLAVLLAACGGGEEGTKEEIKTEEVAPSQEGGVINLGGHLFSIPSPAQTAILMRNAGLTYQKDLVLPLEDSGTAAGRSAAALALGMYGADLAYVTIFEDGAKAMATMQTIERLGNALDMGNAFDRSLLDRFRDNLSNEDSLLQFSGAAFRAADQYLKSNDREDVAALVLAGGWIESLHLTVSDAMARRNKDIAQRVGEQKRTLQDVIALLAPQQDDAVTGQVIELLRELDKEYQGVAIDYVYEKPVTDAAARTTYINSTSSVKISDGQMDAIAEIIAKIRGTIRA